MVCFVLRVVVFRSRRCLPFEVDRSHRSINTSIRSRVLRLRVHIHSGRMCDRRSHCVQFCRQCKVRASSVLSSNSDLDLPHVLWCITAMSKGSIKQPISTNPCSDILDLLEHLCRSPIRIRLCDTELTTDLTYRDSTGPNFGWYGGLGTICQWVWLLGS